MSKHTINPYSTVTQNKLAFLQASARSRNPLADQLNIAATTFNFINPTSTFNKLTTKDSAYVRAFDGDIDEEELEYLVNKFGFGKSAMFDDVVLWFIPQMPKEDQLRAFKKILKITLQGRYFGDDLDPYKKFAKYMLPRLTENELFYLQNTFIPKYGSNDADWGGWEYSNTQFWQNLIFHELLKRRTRRR